MTSKNKTIIDTEDFAGEVDTEVSLFLSEEPEQEGFLPEAATESPTEAAKLTGTELDVFESADIEDIEFVEAEQVESIIESILFASDRPVSLASIQLVFKVPKMD